MKIIHLNHSDINGGAARAAYRIHYSLIKKGISSRMYVNEVGSRDVTVEGPTSIISKVLNKLRPRLISMSFTKMLKTKNKIIHSPSILPSNWVKRINASDADIVHLHWIQNEMISIYDIPKIKKPVVWTLQDMWAFCGAEHYTHDNRWREGYKISNRPNYETGFDLNRWTWERKRRYWKNPVQIITSSRWLAKAVKASALMFDWPVSVIPNAINTNFWKSTNKKLARQRLKLPINATLALFGAIGGTTDLRKGFDLLIGAMKQLKTTNCTKKLQIVVFGQSRPKIPTDLGFKIHILGQINDDLDLRAIYSSADLMLIPSRQDNLPNTGVEAHACSTPIVAFNIGGISDIVTHKHTGYLAKAFDTKDFAKGIYWLLNHENLNQININARKKAITSFSESLVATKYIKIYNQLLKKIK